MANGEQLIGQIGDQFADELVQYLESLDLDSLGDQKIRESMIRNVNMYIADSKAASSTKGIKKCLMDLWNNYFDQGIFQTQIFVNKDLDSITNNICANTPQKLRSESMMASNLQTQWYQDFYQAFTTELAWIAEKISFVSEEMKNKIESEESRMTEEAKGDKEKLKSITQRARAKSMLAEFPILSQAPSEFDNYFRAMRVANEAILKNNSDKMDEAGDSIISDHPDLWKSEIEKFRGQFDGSM